MNYTVFDSLLDVPLEDIDPALDGDDSILPKGEEPFVPPVQLLPHFFSVPATRTIAVPFKGPLKPGMNNKAVQAMSRALAKAKYMPWEPWALGSVYGPIKRRAMIKFKKDHGLDAEPTYGPKAHHFLAPYYDQYAIHNLLEGSLDDAKREKFVSMLMYCYNIRYNLAYTQARPYDRRKPPMGEDCSSVGEWAAEYAGMPSLSGLARGWGNTYSQLSHFRRLGWMRNHVSEGKQGDPLYYGSPSHVTYFLGKDSSGVIRIISNGSHPMRIAPYNYRTDFHWICNLTGK